jgi:hypothetical protein
MEDIGLLPRTGVCTMKIDHNSVVNQEIKRKFVDNDGILIH